MKTLLTTVLLIALGLAFVLYATLGLIGGGLMRCGVVVTFSLGLALGMVVMVIAVLLYGLYSVGDLLKNAFLELE